MKSIIALLLVALLTGGVVYVVMSRGGGETTTTSNAFPKLLKTEKDFRDKVAELKRDRQKLLVAIQQLEQQKSEALQFLKEKGVNSSADITADKEITYALNNLASAKTEISNLTKQADEYDETILSIVAMLDKLKRDQINENVALSEKQLIDLRRIVVDLDDRLDINDKDILQAEERARILDEELKNVESK